MRFINVTSPMALLVCRCIAIPFELVVASESPWVYLYSSFSIKTIVIFHSFNPAYDIKCLENVTRHTTLVVLFFSSYFELIESQITSKPGADVPSLRWSTFNIYDQNVPANSISKPRKSVCTCWIVKMQSCVNSNWMECEQESDNIFDHHHPPQSHLSKIYSKEKKNIWTFFRWQLFLDFRFLIQFINKMEINKNNFFLLIIFFFVKKNVLFLT